MIQRLPRLSFLLAGIALAALIISGFLWYGATQAPYAPFLPVNHRQCGEPVALRAEDYNRWGGTRPGNGLDLALVDFCDPVRVIRDDGREEVWFWMEMEVTGQVYPYTGWGFPWEDVNTPFPAAAREPRNPWWDPRSGIRAYPNELGYLGGDGVSCPFKEMVARGVDLFFYREAGFQLPVGTRHSGWVCLYFDAGRTLPDAFSISVQPVRARITQWVSRLYVVRDTGLYNNVPAMPVISEHDMCDTFRATHPDTIRPGDACDLPPAEGCCDF